ncbi:hypothetical protein CRE_21225 [Caenorhabditis remanei]|uniref:Uncharacterized protein n=1 Tax=Caenorhabditis remanei TaxID=31234 RepID=E3MEY4_CAERE|nr:hypothetical protein CRE_21225 [Caenorhabditis remanei]
MSSTASDSSFENLSDLTFTDEDDGAESEGVKDSKSEFNDVKESEEIEAPKIMEPEDTDVKDSGAQIGDSESSHIRRPRRSLLGYFYPSRCQSLRPRINRHMNITEYIQATKDNAPPTTGRIPRSRFDFEARTWNLRLSELDTLQDRCECLLDELQPMIGYAEIDKSARLDYDEPESSWLPASAKFLMVYMLVLFAIYVFNGVDKVELPTRSVYEGPVFPNFALIDSLMEQPEDPSSYPSSDVFSLAEAMQKFEKLKFEEQLQVKGWTPIPSKFHGLREYMEAIGKNGTSTEVFMQHSKPKFEVAPGRDIILMEYELEGFKVSDIRYLGANFQVMCGEGAQLIMWQVFHVDRKRFDVKRVYFLKNKSLLALL